MDVGYESVMANATKTWMGVRGGFLSFPKVLNNFRVLGTTFDGNLPIDGLITNLFETAYVHPWVAASHLRWFVSDFVIKRVLWVLTGTQAGCNQWAGELPPERQGRAYVFLNKSAKAMQFINRPYRKMSRLHQLFAHYIDPPIPDHVRDPNIHLVPFPTKFDESGKAIFPAPPAHRSKEVGWKEECRPDVVVMCTGYKQEWHWIGEGYPKGPDECNVRGICSEQDLSIGFVGFLRPGVGKSMLLFFSFYMLELGFDLLGDETDAWLRCDTADGRTASSVLLAPLVWPNTGTSYPGELPPATYPHVADPVRRRLFDLYVRNWPVIWGLRHLYGGY